MAQRYIKAFYDWLDNMSELTDEEAGRLFRALLLYAQGENPEFLGNERFVFPSMRAQIDRDKDAYEAVVERNKRNGSKGGRPKSNPENPDEPSGLFGNPENPDEPKTKTKTKTKTKNKINIGGAGGDPAPKRKRFSPPSVEEVRTYINSMGYSVSAQGFVDFYTSNGWKVGKNTMRDWKAAVRGWQARENKPVDPRPRITERRVDFDALYDR